MLAFFRRRADLSAEEFRHYYEAHHAPLALQLFPYLKGYRRNYVRRDQTHRRASGEAFASALDYDVITEITFASPRDYARMQAAMADPAIRDRVVADEQRFMDRDATVVLLVEEEPAFPDTTAG